MNRSLKMIAGLFVAGLYLSSGVAEATLKKGEPAPRFSALDAFQKKPMVIVYFFGLGSRPSRAGLDHLKEVSGLYQKNEIGIVAVSSDEPEKLRAFLKEASFPFPIVQDDGKIFAGYLVKVILPTTYVLGPAGQVTDVLEGGGPSSHQVLTTVAQRTLQLNKTQLAAVLFESALKDDPANARAKAGIGAVYLKEGKIDQAKEQFSKVAALPSPDALLGQEGLARVHLQKGEADQAMGIAKEVERQEPGSGLVHLIRGNVLASQGNQDAALSEYTRASEGKLSTDWERASAYSGAGRIYARKGAYPLAEQMYQEAVVHNPYSPEILTDQGLLYEKKGNPKKALALYQQALTADPDDDISKQLLARMEQHLTFKEDLERQKRVDALVSDLAERFKKGKSAGQGSSDPWSSRPMTVAFLDLRTMGGAPVREGMAEVLESSIAQGLMATGRVTVVEREILDKLLAELKLGSSDLADPETALKLGKVLSARLMVTGNLVQVPQGVRLSLRLIDPETSAIRITYSEEMTPNRGLGALADETTKYLARQIREQYPLQGKIASVEANHQVIVNLGARHGVKPGTQLRIIEEGEPIVVDGKTIGYKKKKGGLVQIIEVEEGLSYGKLMEPQAAIRRDQKVVEEAGTGEKGL